MTHSPLVRGGAAVLTVAAIVVLGVALLAPGGERPQESTAAAHAPPPTPTPAATPPPAPSPTSIVDDPRARIVAVTVRASDADVRSVIWSLCRTPRCRHSDRAVAVTGDGFATRHLLPVPTSAHETPLDGVFLLGAGAGAHLLQPDGSTTPVVWDAGEPGPLRDGEHLVTTHRFGALHAVDSVTGRGHRVTSPRGVTSVVRDGDGLLRGRMLAGPPRLVASSDDGRSWTTTPAPAAAGRLLTHVVASASTARAMVNGGDGATELPFELAQRSDDAGETWTAWNQSARPRAYLGRGAAVLPDGRLLADLIGGGTPSLHRLGRQPSGLWISEGADWSSMAPVALGAPFDALDLRREPSPVLGIQVVRDAVTLYAVTAIPHQTLWSSSDAGTTWREVTSR